MIYIIIIGVILAVSFFFAYQAAKRLEFGPSKIEEIQEGVLLSIELPKENERMPIAAEQMFASLHGLLRFTPDIQEHISLEMASDVTGIHFYVYTPKNFRHFVESQIYAQYPDAEIKEVSDYSKALTSTNQAASTEVILAKDFIFPIKTFKDFAEVDPLAAITSAMSGLKAGESIWLQMLVRPVDDFWQDRGHEYVGAVRAGETPPTLDPGEIAFDVAKGALSTVGDIMLHLTRGPQGPNLHPDKPVPIRLTAGQELELKMIENKLTKMGFETKMRVIVSTGSAALSQARLSSLVASFKQFASANLNSFMADPSSPLPAKMLPEYQKRYFAEDEKNTYILTTEEVASIFHLPNITVETPAIAWARAKKGEPPLNLPTTNSTIIAETLFRGTEVRFGIKRPDRRKHMYIIGKTGTGKSTLIKNMIIQDMRNGEGVAVLDPHGDLIDELLQFVPEERINDVVIFNPADSEHPVSLNMLQLVDPRQRSLMGDSLVDVFKKYFAESWGPRLEYILKNCVLTLLEVPGTTLLSITRLLIDKNYRKFIVDQINDQQMKNFWTVEFSNMEKNERLITEAISPIQNKVGQFLNSELIRNIVGQARSTIKTDEIINTGKIFFVNLAAGRIGANNTALLGAMIISQLQFAAMRRVDIPEEERKDFFLYADEFQNFATDSFAVILSEARKYRLDLTLTHQYIEQMPDPVREAVFGNIGSLLCFTVGPTDAVYLEKEFTPTFLAPDLVNLGRHEVYMKLQIDDMMSLPFSARSLPPMGDAVGSRDRAIKASREQYARPVERVERFIRKWIETRFMPGQKPIEPEWAKVAEESVREMLLEGTEQMPRPSIAPVPMVGFSPAPVTHHPAHHPVHHTESVQPKEHETATVVATSQEKKEGDIQGEIIFPKGQSPLNRDQKDLVQKEGLENE